MGDYDSSLPVRSEADGTDERLQTKIVDKDNPATQQLEVDTDNNAHVEVHGNKPVGSDVTLRLSEEGAPNSDGDYDGTTNTKPASTGVIVHDRNATPADTHQNVRITGKQGVADNTVHAMDMALHDENGDAYTNQNPIPVDVVHGNIADATPVWNYQVSTDVAKDATTTHTYTAGSTGATGSDLYLSKILVSAAGRTKIEIKVGPSGSTSTKVVMFNSTANPNCIYDVGDDQEIDSGDIIEIIITNKDNQPQDVYTTIEGSEF